MDVNHHPFKAEQGFRLSDLGHNPLQLYIKEVVAKLDLSLLATPGH